MSCLNFGGIYFRYTRTALYHSYGQEATGKCQFNNPNEHGLHFRRCFCHETQAIIKPLWQCLETQNIEVLLTKWERLLKWDRFSRGKSLATFWSSALFCFFWAFIKYIILHYVITENISQGYGSQFHLCTVTDGVWHTQWSMWYTQQSNLQKANSTYKASWRYAASCKLWWII